MIRLGVSLPILMRLLGRKDIRMTLRYVQDTQLDLQREFDKLPPALDRSIAASLTSPHSWTASPQPKNEERLASQVAHPGKS